jgi:Fe-S oxidoreductase
VFKELGWESDGARGKTILAYGLLAGELEPSQYIADKLYQCTYCKDCVERCSANISVPDILTAARADMIRAGFTYDAHIKLLDKINNSGNIFGKKLGSLAVEGEMPVLLGCRFRERTDDAKRYLDILRKLGIKPKVVDEEVCCGMPFAVLGYKKEFATFKKKFMERFPFKEFICLCTTCVFFIRKAYSDLSPIYVIDEIAKRLPNTKTKKLGIKATYHDPCNVARGMGMVDEPRQIMKQIGVELVELPTNRKQAECCGGGGGVLVTDKALSEKMAEKRVKQALEIGVDKLATLCPTCELNLKNNAGKNGGKLEVKNLLDYIGEALN